jgi:tRNA(Ile)-lysidine synthase
MTKEPALERHVEGVLCSLRLLDADLILALSGGIDSIVLLDILAALSVDHSLRLRALHIDHAISANAARWAAFCRRRCADYGIACEIVEVQVTRGHGESLEAAARRVRHAVFRRQAGDAVLLAHQLDDQAETVMLQLLRGAGVDGLAAMPRMRAAAWGRPALVRPLLEIPRDRIRAFAEGKKLEWVADESNVSLNFDRNYLRLQLMPRLALRFRGYRETLSRTAVNMGEAAEVMEEVARQDAGDALERGALSLDTLRRLSPARARNVLRWFIVQHGLRVPSRQRLLTSLSQFLDARGDRHPRLELESGALQRHAGQVRFVPACPPVPEGWRLTWQGEGCLTLPYQLGRVCFEHVRGSGLRRALLERGATLRLRTGGERMRLSAHRPVRALKDLLREAGVASWQRQRLPLLFCGDSLCWVPGIGWDCRFAAAPEEAGVVPGWRPAGGAAEGG